MIEFPKYTEASVRDRCKPIGPLMERSAFLHNGGLLKIFVCVCVRLYMSPNSHAYDACIHIHVQWRRKVPKSVCVCVWGGGGGHRDT